MNTPEIVSIALSGSAVLSTGIAALALRNAVRKGCTIAVNASVRITPPAVPKVPADASVQQIAKRNAA